MSPIKVVISDFGGVLTTPLMGSFAAFQDRTGISGETLAQAMQVIAERDGAHPLFELEMGRMTEAHYLEQMADALEPELGHRPQMVGFKEIFFEALDPNEPMIALMRELAASHRTALLTNNIREWEPFWRAKLPVDEIFELVVDSAFVGMRKPDLAIYQLTVERLGDGIAATECLFVDDVAVNIEAARELGMTAVHFRDNDQAIPEIRRALS